MGERNSPMRKFMGGEIGMNLVSDGQLSFVEKRSVMVNPAPRLHHLVRRSGTGKLMP